jgi:pimeloyl-ACP methyl ester carboxylesterase/DNA-binding CsgD family transcriptional regulator
MASSAQQIRFCTSRDSTRIAYAICGNGPPLLFAQHWVHHLELDWDSLIWRPWLELLSRRHTVIRYDWRGCGLSDRNNVDLSADRYLEDLAAVAEAAKLTRFTLFGMAQGARIAMPYAASHPDRVSRLILYQPSTSGRGAPGRRPDEAEEERARFKAMELGWQSHPSSYVRFFTSMYVPDATSEHVRAYNDLLRLATSPESAIAIQRAFHVTDVRAFVAKVRCPTLVLHSRRNAIVPFDEGRAVAALIPEARFVPLESGNHILLDSEPAWPHLVEAIEDFLQVPAPASAPAALGELSARENEVLELVAQGLDNTTIGKRLGISERTARNHVSTILSKLGVNSRAQAIVRAREAGFGQRTAARSK